MDLLSIVMLIMLLICFFGAYSEGFDNILSYDYFK